MTAIFLPEFEFEFEFEFENRAKRPSFCPQKSGARIPKSLVDLSVMETHDDDGEGEGGIDELFRSALSL